MMPERTIRIRKFEKRDIPKKVEWINNPENNRFLHYDIPISEGKTEQWFDKHYGEDTRFDAVIEVDNTPIGTIGLLNIDKKNSKAEYYIAMGEPDYKGKGFAKRASLLILKYGFEDLGLNRIYLFTEVDNVVAQKMFEHIGFVKEGIVHQDTFSHGKFVDRIIYGLLKEDWLK